MTILLSNSLPVRCRGKGAIKPGSPADFTLAFPPVNFLVKGVKIYVNTNHNLNTWEQIDSVMLFGEAGGGGLAPLGTATPLAPAIASTRVSAVGRSSPGPFATFAVVGPVVRGRPVTFTLSNPCDRPGAGPVSGFRYSFDFNNDGDFTDPGELRDAATSSASYTFTIRGWHVVRARVRAPDGRFTDFWIRVFVP